MRFIFEYFNPTALRTAKTPSSFGHSECNRVKEVQILTYFGLPVIKEYVYRCVKV